MCFSKLAADHQSILGEHKYWNDLKINTYLVIKPFEIIRLLKSSFVMFFQAGTAASSSRACSIGLRSNDHLGPYLLCWQCVLGRFFCCMIKLGWMAGNLADRIPWNTFGCFHHQ